MPSSLNVVALISGGKDSLYSILHCIQNGHNVVALANLFPPTAMDTKAGSTHSDAEACGEMDDMDSFMYQTVGHSVVPLYASALKLPLYRRSISGTATQTGRYYAYTDAGPLDETEALVPLLQEVMQHHVEVNAICSGAILSTYQRTRIESVAIRLGLIPLAFLWQYPALPPPVERADSITGLLDDMAAAGCDSHIIKTASGGLKDTMLWANVASSRTRNQLVTAMSPFFEGHEFWLRGSVLGEGGEYETLAVNGPSRVWKQRIVIEQEGNMALQGEGGTCHLRLGRARLSEQEQIADDQKSRLVRIPGLYDPAFAILDGKFSLVSPSSPPFIRGSGEWTEAPHLAPLHKARLRLPGNSRLKMSIKSTYSSISISNMTTTECSGAGHKTRHLIKLLRAHIHSINRGRAPSAQLSVDDVVFTLVVLDSMTDFAAVNTEYGKVFTLPNPPARVTIASGSELPDNVQVCLSIVLDTGPRPKRRGLHVQSRSYWAPANIGPYSQAISVPIASGEEGSNGEDGEVVHVAGQIPLVPHTMEIMEGTFLQQTILALQHLWRVGQEREVDLWTHGVAYLAKPNVSSRANTDRVQTIWRIWKEAHAWSQQPQDAEGDEGEESGLDVWDLRNNPHHHRDLTSLSTQADKPSGTHLHPLPRVSVVQNSTPAAAISCSTSTPPLLIAEVDSLPRAAPIEWHSLGLGCMPTTNPRIHLSNSEKGPVSVSHCTVLANAPTQQGDDGSESPAKTCDPRTGRPADIDFVTIQVLRPDEEVRQSEEDVEPPTTWSISTIASTISDVVDTAGGWTVAHGTVFVAGPSGWSVLDLLHGQPATEAAGGGLVDNANWQGLSIIPCHTLWGAVSSEAGERVGSLDIAVVLRLERS